MKIRILDRILVALAGLLVLAGCAALAAQLFFGKNVTGWISTLMSDGSARIYLIAGLVLLTVLGCYCVLVLFRRRGKKDKFIMQKTENGELAISLKAMESMVVKCLEPHKELNTQSVRLENQKGGLLIRIRGTVAGGVSIPLTVDALQQQIKQYVTACSGVEVKDIRVQIESSGPEAKDAPFAIEAPAGTALLGEGREEAKPEKTEEKEEKLPEIPPVETKQEPEEVPETVFTEKAEPVIAAPKEAAAAAAAAEQLLNEAEMQEEEEDDDRPIHQRLFSNRDEPCVMPMPPESSEEGPEETASGDGTKDEGKKEEEKTGAIPEEGPETGTGDARMTEGSEA